MTDKNWIKRKGFAIKWMRYCVLSVALRKLNQESDARNVAHIVLLRLRKDIKND